MDYIRVIHSILSRFKSNIDVCYITIDEKTVTNESHRRSGIHVDHNWYEATNSHVAPGTGGHERFIGSYTGSHTQPGKWRPRYDEVHGGMLLISNYPGCEVFGGNFEGEIGKGGDCSNINLFSLNSEIMAANQVYLLNALCIHRPLVIQGPVNRQLIRINFHPDHIIPKHYLDYEEALR